MSDCLSSFSKHNLSDSGGGEKNKKKFMQGKMSEKKIHAKTKAKKNRGFHSEKKFLHREWARKKFVQAENSPPPHHFFNGPSLRISLL